MDPALPPHDLEAEEAALAAGLWADIEAYTTGLEPGDFWAPQHGAIWAVLLSVEELLGCDAGWTTRIWAVLRTLPGLREERLMEILQAAPLRRTRDAEIGVVRQLSERRRAIGLLQRAEARLR